jgi:CRP/FNR family cyclic AMP-dependent transcriptional regulator
MTDTLGLTPEQLRSIPLFRAVTDEQLATLAGLFVKVEAKGGDTLFEIGDKAHSAYLLVEGEITLHRADDDTHKLRGPAVIGELGGLTGLVRNSRAVAEADAELWKVPGTTLRDAFDRDPHLGVGFQYSLLETVADKIDRDQTRLSDMRSNLIRTQKAMKKMRDFLLESVDTEISETLHEMLDGLIKRNRRVNYRVEPPLALTATVHFEQGGDELSVVEISRTHFSFQRATPPAVGDRVSAVLNLSGPEFPVSGSVLRVIDGRVDVKFDMMIDEYVTLLEGYLTRVQMLDFLV